MTQSEKQKVREEFVTYLHDHEVLRDTIGVWGREQIMNYLVQKLEEGERELVERIDDLKIEHPTKDHNSYGEGYDTGYNDALNEIKNSITKEGGA